MLERLAALTLLHGISGYEDRVRAYIRGELNDLASQARIDRLGNLYVQFGSNPHRNGMKRPGKRAARRAVKASPCAPYGNRAPGASRTKRKRDHAGRAVTVHEADEFDRVGYREKRGGDVRMGIGQRNEWLDLGT